MKCLILGTSNSLLGNGWLAGLRDTLPDIEVDNRSVGGSPGLQFSCEMGADFSLYDYVFFDSSVNDDVLLDFVGSEQFINRATYEMLATIASESKLIVIGIPRHSDLGAPTSLYRARPRLAQAVGAQFLDVGQLVHNHWQCILSPGEDAYTDFAHPARRLQRLIGQELGKAIGAGAYPDCGRFSASFADKFSVVNCASFWPRTVRKSNSLFNVVFAELGPDDTIDFGSSRRCVGFYVDIRRCLSFVTLENNSETRAKEFWCKSSASEGFDFRFIAIHNGFQLSRIRVAGSVLPFERSNYTAFSDYPNESRPSIMTVERFGFWDGDPDAPIPFADGDHLAITRIIDDALRNSVSRAEEADRMLNSESAE